MLQNIERDHMKVVEKEYGKELPSVPTPHELSVPGRVQLCFLQMSEEGAAKSRDNAVGYPYGEFESMMASSQRSGGFSATSGHAGHFKCARG